MENKKFYVRFGDIPKDEISRAYRSGIAYREEKGVSVWNCACANDVYFPILPQNPSESCVADYFSFIWGDRPVYLVTGEEVGIGSACEPILKNVVVIKELTEEYNYLKTLWR